MKQIEQNVSIQETKQESYVVQKLTDTLFLLLRKYHLKQISISALCDIAGIGRASFYRNFTSKEDILKKYDKKLIEEWGKKFENDKNATMETLIPSLLIHYQKHKDFYLMLYHEQLTNIVLETILYACKLQEKKTNIEAYVTSFVAYGIFGIVNEWISRGMEETPEQLFALIAQNKS